MIANFTPDSIDAATVQPFKAIHFVFDGRSPSSASVADFTIAGPLVESALNIDDRIRHLVHDQKNDRYYGLTQHEFGVVSPTSRTFEEIAVDPSLKQDFSWPKGLAMDPGTGEIIVRIVAASVVGGGRAEATQSAAGTVVGVAPENRRPIDTVLRLDLDGPAGTLAPR